MQERALNMAEKTNYLLFMINSFQVLNIFSLGQYLHHMRMLHFLNILCLITSVQLDNHYILDLEVKWRYKFFIELICALIFIYNFQDYEQTSGCPNNFRFSYARLTLVYTHWDHTMTCILCFAAEFGGRACPRNDTSVSKPKAVEYSFFWTTSGNFRFSSL